MSNEQCVLTFKSRVISKLNFDVPITVFTSQVFRECLALCTSSRHVERDVKSSATVREPGTYDDVVGRDSTSLCTLLESVIHGTHRVRNDSVSL